MGCFATCFINTCKPSPRRRRRGRSRSLKTCPLLDHLQNYQSIEDFELLHLIQEDGDEKEEQREDNAGNTTDLSPDASEEKRQKKLLSGRKKVTFDLNVKFYETLPRDEEEIDEEERYSNYDDDEDDEDEDDETIKKVKACECSSDSSSPSLLSFPLNYRYQNCRDTDDEFDDALSSDESDVDYYTDDNDSDDDEEMLIEKPIPNDSQCDRSKNVDFLTNAIANVTLWKDIKVRSRIRSKDEPKENSGLDHDFSFSVKNKALQNHKETGVDASLSTWLAGSQKENSKSGRKPFLVYSQFDKNTIAPSKFEERLISEDSESNENLIPPNKVEGRPILENSQSKGKPISSNSERKQVSPKKFEDRPILGALTVEEIREKSTSSTSSKSPTWRNDNDRPIIGSVGSYWSRTVQTNEPGGSSAKGTKSRYRESAEVIWDPTPFETRLETALEREANVEQVLCIV